MEHSDRPFSERAAEYETSSLPVPADTLVYTVAEWEALQAAGSRFARVLESEAVWVYRRDEERTGRA